MFHSSVLLSTNFYFYIPRYRHYVRLFFFFLMIRRPPRSTLFPTRRSSDLPTVFEFLRKERGLPPEETWVVATNKRSEEHTSELQSRLHLVCRLLLEKKKTHS